MTFSAVGTQSSISSSTVGFTPATVGDFLLLEIINASNSTVTATGVSSSNATWTALTSSVAGTTNAATARIFIGQVTSATNATITISWSGTTPAVITGTVQEFSSSGGFSAVHLDKSAMLDSAATTTWASLTPSGGGELYFGFASDSATATAGSTSGYTYQVTTSGDGVAYNLNCASGVATAPVWGDGNQDFGQMALLSDAVSTQADPAWQPQIPPGLQSPAAWTTPLPPSVPYVGQPWNDLIPGPPELDNTTVLPDQPAQLTPPGLQSPAAWTVPVPPLALPWAGEPYADNVVVFDTDAGHGTDAGELIIAADNTQVIPDAPAQPVPPGLQSPAAWTVPLPPSLPWPSDPWPDNVVIFDTDAGHGTDAGEAISTIDNSTVVPGIPVLPVPPGLQSPAAWTVPVPPSLPYPGQLWADPAAIVITDSDSGHFADAGELIGSIDNTTVVPGLGGLATVPGFASPCAWSVMLPPSLPYPGQPYADNVVVFDTDAGTGTDAGEAISDNTQVLQPWPPAVPPGLQSPASWNAPLPPAVPYAGQPWADSAVVYDTDSGHATDAGELITSTDNTTVAPGLGGLVVPPGLQSPAAWTVPLPPAMPWPADPWSDNVVVWDTDASNPAVDDTEVISDNTQVMLPWPPATPPGLQSPAAFAIPVPPSLPWQGQPYADNVVVSDTDSGHFTDAGEQLFATDNTAVIQVQPAPPGLQSPAAWTVPVPPSLPYAGQPWADPAGGITITDADIGHFADAGEQVGSADNTTVVPGLGGQTVVPGMQSPCAWTVMLAPSLPWAGQPWADNVVVFDTDSGHGADAGEVISDNTQVLQPWPPATPPGLQSPAAFAVPLPPSLPWAGQPFADNVVVYDSDAGHGADGGELVALSDSDASNPGADAGEVISDNTQVLPPWPPAVPPGLMSPASWNVLLPPSIAYVGQPWGALPGVQTITDSDLGGGVDGRERISTLAGTAQLTLIVTGPGLSFVAVPSPD